MARRQAPQEEMTMPQIQQVRMSTHQAVEALQKTRQREHAQYAKQYNGKGHAMTATVKAAIINSIGCVVSVCVVAYTSYRIVLVWPV